MASKTHVVLTGSKRGKDPTAVRVRNVDPKEKIVVTIGLRGPDLPGPDDYIGQTMTPKELAKKFSARNEDADKEAKVLKTFGHRVEEVSLVTRSMRVSGTAEAMEAAFKPDWAIVRSPRQGRYRGRQGLIHIPKELEGIVTGVFGLDQRRMAHRKSRAASSAGRGTARSPLTPACIEEHYNFPSGDGGGQSIAIAEFGGGYFKEDMKKYCNQFHRSVPNVQRIPVGAPAYTLQQILDLQDPQLRFIELESSFEVMMDVELIGGLCPNADISVYFSTTGQDGWVNLLNKVIAETIATEVVPVALSISCGWAEDDQDQWSLNGLDHINERLKQLSRLGITTCVASGDGGSGYGIDDSHAHVDFPSSSPYVMGVGGTMLTKSGEEVTWNDSDGATGGGVSTVYPRPDWQDVHVASVNLTHLDGRVVPDVSALAGEPYYDLVFLGFRWPQAGTSASAPVWAALIARINANLPQDKPRRFLTPLLYTNSIQNLPVGQAPFRHITTGNNISTPPGIGYYAGPGFNAATGWGVPDGKKLLKCLRMI